MCMTCELTSDSQKFGFAENLSINTHSSITVTLRFHITIWTQENVRPYETVGKRKTENKF